MEGNLAAISVPLWVVAIASALQTLILIGVLIGALRMYREVSEKLAEVQARQLDPLRGQVERILVDVQAIASRLNTQTERVDHAISGTMERVDETAERVKHSVRGKVAQATGVVMGLRAVIMSLLGNGSRTETSAEATGRV
jgi:uncharacterized protein YoxC